MMLRNQQGEWVEDKEKLRNIAMEFYKNLFNEDACARPWFATTCGFPMISDDDMEMLDVILVLDEIRGAMFGMGFSHGLN